LIFWRIFQSSKEQL